MNAVESLLEKLCQLTQIPYHGLQQSEIAFVLNQSYRVRVKVKEQRLLIQGEVLPLIPQKESLMALEALKANLALGLKQAPWLSYDEEAHQLKVVLSVLWEPLSATDLKAWIEQLVIVQIQMREALQIPPQIQLDASHKTFPQKPQAFVFPA